MCKKGYRETVYAYREQLAYKQIDTCKCNMVPDSNTFTSAGEMAQEEMTVDFHTLLAKKDKVKAHSRQQLYMHRICIYRTK